MTRLLALLCFLVLGLPTLRATVQERASLHYVQGNPMRMVTGQDQTFFTVTFSGTLAGIGNQPLTATRTLGGTATSQCQNPGGNVAPGQMVPVPDVSSTPIILSPNQNERKPPVHHEPGDVLGGGFASQRRLQTQVDAHQYRR
jgi:hypothetical protein